MLIKLNTANNMMRSNDADMLTCSVRRELGCDECFAMNQRSTRGEVDAKPLVDKLNGPCRKNEEDQAKPRASKVVLVRELLLLCCLLLS